MNKTPPKPDSDTILYGQSILEAEGSAILKLSEKLSNSFVDALALINRAPKGSRIVVSGIGKAGFVAMKFSATLASIGYPSLYLHPADALHGDLGRLTTDDIAVLFSHSGETSELIRLLPTFKHFGVEIIAVTSSLNSTLGQSSHVVIEIGRVEEAGPLGLAPTTSTSIMMALADALAMTLIYQRGFTKEEFATFHPGGALGKSLLKVSDIMRSGDAHCVVSEKVPTKDALHAISSTKGRPGAAAIVNHTGVIVGIFTDGNLRRCLEQSTDFLEKPISKVASSSPKTIKKSLLASEAASVIAELKVDQLIVVDDENKPIGLVDIQDLLTYGLIRDDSTEG